VLFSDIDIIRAPAFYLNLPTMDNNISTKISDASQKRQEIELLRIFSAFGIIWYHSASTGRDVAYAGLVAFLIISLYFSAKIKSPPKPVLERAKILLLPWIVWSIFYGAINLVQNRPFFSLDNGITAGLLTGASLHLWYMPFIFIVIIIFDYIKRYLTASMLCYACVALALTLLWLNSSWHPLALALGAPYAQYAHALDGVFIGVFFANCSALPRAMRAGFIAAILAFVLLFSWSVPGMGITYLVGIALAAIILLPDWNMRFPVNISVLSECTLGIYLSHVFWIKVVSKFGIQSEIALSLLVFGISALTILALKRFAPRVARYTA